MTYLVIALIEHSHECLGDLLDLGRGEHLSTLTDADDAAEAVTTIARLRRRTHTEGVVQLGTVQTAKIRGIADETITLSRSPLLIDI